MPAPDWYHPIDYADVTALRRVSLAARAVFLEAFGAELGSKTGLVEIRPNLIAAESDGLLTRIGVERCLEELASAGIIVWSQPERMAYHLGHLLRHGATNPKHAAGWKAQLLAMPACSARDAAVCELGGIPYRKGIDTLSEGYRLGNQQEQEQEQEQEQITPLPTVAAPTGATAPVKERKERAPRATFTEPTEAETLAIVQSLVPTLQQFRQERIAAACYSYWQSCGWKRKSGPIKDWPATVRTWVTNQADRDKGVSVALASKPAKPAAPVAAEVYPYYAKSGKGLDAPEYYDPEYGWTDMTEARWKETGDALPF